jgi:O-antigen/teichoic acid export membrane protein
LGKKLLKNSKHYVLAALMLVLIQNTDHIMLTLMISKEENGFYSAAITTAGIFQFVYTAIVDSYRPVILADKKENSNNYIINMTRLYSITLYLSIAQSLVFTFGAKFIIGILYGSDYLQAVPVLRILVWFLAFAMMGSVRNVWILAEQKQRCLWIINLGGAIFNILLNTLFIRPFGACGAAFASLMTQIFTNLILGFIWKPLRDNNNLILNSLHPQFAFGEAKKLIFMVLRKEK